MAAVMKPFVTPPFLEGETVESIHARMMTNLPADIDRSEGGFPWDYTRPTANEKAEYINYNLINTIRGIFAMHCDPFLLDYHADKWGMKRRAAVQAKAILQMTGDAGIEIPAGFVVSTEASYNRPSISFTTDGAVTLGGEPVSVTITAVDAGADGNVGAHTIVIVDSPIKGLSTIDNAAPAFGGIDEESDDSLRERVVEYEQTQGVSFVGSYIDYKRWALEVTGVGSVQVQGGQDGDCTVKLILTGSDGNPASEEICQDVYNHIMRPDAESQRLASVCDLLIVKPATTIQVTVEVTVELDGTVRLDDLQEELRLRLESYYHGDAIDQGEVKYTSIGTIIRACAGITDYDYTTLKVNGGTRNIPVSIGEIPVTATGDITLTEGMVT